MYGYIDPEGVVGQLFQVMPEERRFHPDFIASIAALPEGVTCGWRRAGNDWLPPQEREGDGGIAELVSRLEQLEGALEIMLGGDGNEIG